MQINKILEKLSFTFLLLFSFCSYGQNNLESNINLKQNQDSISYFNKCKFFLKEINPSLFKNSSIILVDIPFSIESDYYNCLTNILLDTLFFTKEEISLVKNKNYPTFKKWTTLLLDNTNIIIKDTIESILNNDSKGWKYFKKEIGHYFSFFSFPIFLRNDKYCLFYSDYHCGSLCGGGGLTLYVKKKRRWTALKYYCGWAS